MAKHAQKSIHKDRAQRLADLEDELLAALKGPKLTIPIAKVCKKGLLTALREYAAPKRT